MGWNPIKVSGSLCGRMLVRYRQVIARVSTTRILRDGTVDKLYRAGGERCDKF